MPLLTLQIPYCPETLEIIFIVFERTLCFNWCGRNAHVVKPVCWVGGRLSRKEQAPHPHIYTQLTVLSTSARLLLQLSSIDSLHHFLSLVNFLSLIYWMAHLQLHCRQSAPRLVDQSPDELSDVPKHRDQTRPERWMQSITHSVSSPPGGSTPPL